MSQREIQLEAVAEAVRKRNYFDAYRLVQFIDGHTATEPAGRLMASYEEAVLLREADREYSS